MDHLMLRQKRSLAHNPQISMITRKNHLFIKLVRDFLLARLGNQLRWHSSITLRVLLRLVEQRHLGHLPWWSMRICQVKNLNPLSHNHRMTTIPLLKMNHWPSNLVMPIQLMKMNFSMTSISYQLSSKIRVKMIYFCFLKTSLQIITVNLHSRLVSSLLQ